MINLRNLKCFGRCVNEPTEFVGNPRFKNNNTLLKDGD